MRRQSCAILFCAAILASCASQPAVKTVTLPSGKVVRVTSIRFIGVGPIHFASGKTSLMLSYQTDLKTSDHNALRKEVEEIRSSFQRDADNGHVDSVIISANEVPTGAITKRSQAYNFVYKKNLNGSWQLQ